MIPYEELAAALERWRVNQGLPTGTAMLDGGSPDNAGLVAAAVAAPGAAEPAYAEPSHGDAPAYAEPSYGDAPAYAEPEPAYAEPAPAYAEPSYAEPAPAYAEPTPAYGETAPAYAEPSYGDAPAYAEESPAYGEANYGASPPPPPPPPPLPLPSEETYDDVVDDLGDDVVEEPDSVDSYRGEQDYAMSVGPSTAGTIGAEDEDEERTQIGPMTDAPEQAAAPADDQEAGDEVWPDPSTWNADAAGGDADPAAEEDEWARAAAAAQARLPDDDGGEPGH